MRLVAFYILAIHLLCSAQFSSAQGNSSADIYQSLEELKSPYRVLYLAAHPDDENTRLIGYFTKEVKARTAYLSLTRGDGGQNLIGKEKGALLGSLRTEELLAARRVDGSEQFFTRAIDFGYSKTSEETFNFWGKEIILSDVVFVVRYYKPHVIINRFPTDNYSGHGHHQASAILSVEAFDKASDDAYEIDQVANLGSWKVGTIYQNSSTWWDKTLPERARNDLSIKEINIGAYNKMLGYSYNELAAYSRSQHKSQGFGSAPEKGDQFEYLEFLKGSFDPGIILNEALLDDVDRKWLSLTPRIDSLLRYFDHSDPSLIVPSLLQLRKKATTLDTLTHRFDQKIKQLDDILWSCMGFSIELISQDEVVNKGESISAHVEAVNRSAIPVYLEEIRCWDNSQSWNRRLDENLVLKDTFLLNIPENARYSSPYWLRTEGEYRYNISQNELRRPDNKALEATVVLRIEEELIEMNVEIFYKWTDRVRGGLKKSLAILPRITVAFDKAHYFPKEGKISGNILVSSQASEKIDGKLVLDSDSGISFQSFNNLTIGANSTLSVPFSASVTLDQLKRSDFNISFITASDTFNQQLIEVNYDHIRPQNVLMPASSKLVPLELKEHPGKIAYVSGPDNEIVPYLKEIGLDVDFFTEDDLLNGKLSSYQVLLFGIRSINIAPSWNTQVVRIQDFIKKGGLVIVQYQTNGGINPLRISPYSFEISRLRVTDESAFANIVRPDHRILNTPYKLTRSDFNGWNQERGLYFADNWEENFTTVLSWHDANELDLFGGLIVGDYGKGAFIYTGISFFRHIPYGSAGSYKLLINILSYRNGRN